MSGAPRLPEFFRLVAHERIDSTNEEARRLAAQGAVEGTLVWAREQTAGRGRRGRRWSSPPGNLYMSLLLRPACAPATAPQIGFLAAVSLGEALEALLPVAAEVRFKWPNDVLVGRAKIAGILLEASGDAMHGLDWLILGMGINVASAPGDTPYAATSLHWAGSAATVEDVLEALTLRLQHWYGRWQTTGFEPVRERWLSGVLGLGEQVEVRLERETLSGRFAALDATGGLELELPQGGRRRIAAGDVYYPSL